MLSRRRFIFVGLAGAVAVAATTLIVRSRSTASPADGQALMREHRGMLAVIAVALLDNALPADAADRDTALNRVLAAAAALIDNLPPSTRAEIAELFSLLSVKPARALLGYSGDWAITDVAAVATFLAGLRSSAIALKQQAYFALHDVLLGSFYADPSSWAATGYPGPPRLA